MPPVGWNLSTTPQECPLRFSSKHVSPPKKKRIALRKRRNKQLTKNEKGDLKEAFVFQTCARFALRLPRAHLGGPLSSVFGGKNRSEHGQARACPSARHSHRARASSYKVKSARASNAMVRFFLLESPFWLAKGTQPAQGRVGICESIGAMHGKCSKDAPTTAL